MAKKILSDVSEMEQVFNKQFFGFPMMFLTVHRHLKDRQMYRPERKDPNVNYQKE